MDVTLIVLGAALLFGLMFLAGIKFKPVSTTGSIDKAFVAKKWEEIKQVAATPNQSARFAVIEADKLLDFALKSRGYPGETMADRMRSAREDFSYIDDVWSAHKLRNKLVHEAEYEVDRRLVDRAMNQFQQALKDLGAM